MKRAAAAFILFVALSPMAHAECERDMADAQAVVPRIDDASQRMRAAYFLKRVQRELDEGDEFECSEAISQIQKIVATAKLAPEAAAK